MNDDYDNHIIQKYRLAVAIAIIRNTPKDSTPKDYLNYLKNNIIQDMEPYDPDMTICEDDFSFDNNDNTIFNVKDKNEANGENQLFDSQTNDSDTILKDFDFNEMIRNMNNDREIIENNSVTDILNILKENEGKTIQTENVCIKGNHSQSTYYASSQSQQQQTVILNENKPQMKHHSQESAGTTKALQDNSNKIIKTKVDPKNVSISSAEADTYYHSQMNIFHSYTDNLTHVSQSQVDNIVVPRFLIQKERPKETNSILPANQFKHNFDVESKMLESGNRSDSNKTSQPIQRKLDRDHVMIPNAEQTNSNKKHKHPTEDNNYTVITPPKRTRDVDENKSLTTDVTYINEIKNNLELNARNITFELDSNENVKTIHADIIRNPLGKSDNVNNSSLDYCKEKKYNDLNKVRAESEANTSNRYDSLDLGSQTSIESNANAYIIAYNNQNFSQISQEFDSELSNNTEPAIEVTSNSIKQKKEAELKEESEEEKITEDLFDKMTDSQTDVVPFKVLEELNKIKSYLNTRNRSSSDCVSDSGYKSDSQSRSSFKSALHSSNVWINESAFCLVKYISGCPLILNTETITKEISKTLGRLIDKLHEDEKYPSFLEEHLHSVDNLLKEIYEEESADKLFQKDENIHRLFLLNKSSHIIKYTIEKIIVILEDMLAKLAEEDLLETSYTVQTENLSYIFHILETLVKKMVVYKNFSSQHSTQNSQEDEGILKKSSITDIWRKKWNFVKKSENSDATSHTKPCVLVRCSEVLNKIIVQAMDGYSLISYFALQCFNLLQN